MRLEFPDALFVPRTHGKEVLDGVRDALVFRLRCLVHLGVFEAAAGVCVDEDPGKVGPAPVLAVLALLPCLDVGGPLGVGSVPEGFFGKSEFELREG